jgi:hypothetical protein
MQLRPSASSVNQSRVQPRYSGGIGVSGNQPLFLVLVLVIPHNAFAWGGGVRIPIPLLLTGDL